MSQTQLDRLEAETFINVDVFFQAIRRMFDGSPRTILSELLQNAQRAGATEVHVTTTTDTVVYHDNGGGLTDGPEGVIELLRLGESRYNDPRVALEQKPMGMGFYALLANDQVTAVTVQSNAIEFSLDPAQWWASTAHRQDWLRRYKDTARNATVSYTPGFTLRIACTPAFATAVAELLPELISDAGVRDYPYSPPYPAEGAHLAITCNGRPVATAVRRRYALPEAPITFTYQGNPVRVALDPHWPGTRADACWINWYGQAVFMSAPAGLRVYYDVWQGTPLTPKAPTRDGIVEDAARAAFWQAVADHLFGLATGPTPPALDLLITLFHLDKARAETLPWVVLRTLTPWDGQDLDYEAYTFTNGYYIADLTDHEVAARSSLAERRVLAKEQLMVLSSQPDGTVETFEAELGLPSLLAGIQAQDGQPTSVLCYGDAPTAMLWWRCQADPRGYFVTAPGQWGLSPDGATLPRHWHDLPADHAYVVCSETQIDYFDTDDYRVWRGPRTEVAALSYLAYLCQHADEDSDNPQEDNDNFASGVESFHRDHFARNAISRNWSRDEIGRALRRVLGDEFGHLGPIATLAPGGRTLTVTFASGRQVELVME